MIRAMLIALSALILAGCSQSEAPDENSQELPLALIAFEAADSTRIYSWIRTSPDSLAPLVIGLPMLGATRQSYEPFFDAIASYTAADSMAPRPIPHLVALDLRGHGMSVYRTDDTVRMETMPTAEFGAMPSDVAMVVDSLVARLGHRIDPSQVFLIGASIGANAAIMATQYTDAIDKVVLLSPGTEYRGLKPAEAFREFEGETLVVVARGDKYAYESSQQLIKEKMAGWLLKAYGGSEHGTDLIDKNGQARQDVLDWLFGETN